MTTGSGGPAGGASIGGMAGMRKGLECDAEAEDRRAVELPGVPAGRARAGVAPGRRPEKARPLVAGGNPGTPWLRVAAPGYPGAVNQLTRCTRRRGAYPDDPSEPGALYMAPEPGR